MKYDIIYFIYININEKGKFDKKTKKNYNFYRNSERER